MNSVINRSPSLARYLSSAILKPTAQTSGKCVANVKACSALYPLTRSLTYSVDNDFITINHADTSRKLSFHWLRDHSRSPESYNHDTFQKKILPHRIDPNIKPTDIQTQDDTLLVQWSDGDKASYNMSWLLENSYPGVKEPIPKLIWNKEILSKEDLPMVQFKVMGFKIDYHEPTTDHFRKMA